MTRFRQAQPATLSFGIWNLFVIWNLELGTWNLFKIHLLAFFSQQCLICIKPCYDLVGCSIGVGQYKVGAKVELAFGDVTRAGEPHIFSRPAIIAQVFAALFGFKIKICCLHQPAARVVYTDVIVHNPVFGLKGEN
jgi:hypothetical protein